MAEQAQAQPLGQDDHRQGLTAQSPITYLLGAVFFGAAFIFFTMLQITSTQDAVFGFLQISIHTPPGMTGPQLLEFINGTLDRNHTIATAIAWGVQCYLLQLAFPSDRAFLMAHKKYNTGMSKSVSNKALLLAKLKTFVTWTLILGDVITDFMYAAAGHAMVGGMHFFIIPNITNPGGLLVALLYPIVICGVTVFFGAEAFHRLDAFLSELGRRARAGA